MDTRNSSLESSVVVGRIMQLLSEKSVTELDLTEYLGIHPNTVKNWRKNRSDSYLHYLKEISDSFNVTPNYLILGEDGYMMGKGEELFSKDELKIIEMYQKMKCDNKYSFQIDGIDFRKYAKRQMKVKYQYRKHQYK